MQTVEVELRNIRAIRLLEELEELKLIRLVYKNKKDNKVKTPGKLSLRTVKALHKHVADSRKSWEKR